MLSIISSIVVRIESPPPKSSLPSVMLVVVPTLTVSVTDGNSDCDHGRAVDADGLLMMSVKQSRILQIGE